MAKIKENNLISICLPLLPDEGGAGETDQTVPVTINGKTTTIKRGEFVEVPFEIYNVLYQSGRFKGM